MVQSTKSKRINQLMTTSPLPGTTINAVALKISLASGSAAADNNFDDNNNRNVVAKKKKQRTFLFDTPGLHRMWHETFPFNLRDQVNCLIRRRFSPDAVFMEQGHTFFFSAAACIDVVKASEPLMFFSYHSARVTTAHCPTEQSDAYWREYAGTRLNPPGTPHQIFDGGASNNNNDDSSSTSSTSGAAAAVSVSGNGSLCVKRSYLFECFENHRKRPKADIYFCGIGWVSFFAFRPCDVVLRVRTLPGIVHGVRQPLRKRDMVPYRPWPKLPRVKTTTNTKPEHRIEDVIELDSSGSPDDVDLNAPPIVPVDKTEPISALPPSFRASNTPFEFIMQELQKQGKMSQS